MLEFAETLKDDETLAFDKEHDKMIVIFDADIFEEKVSGYEALIKEGEKSNIIGITNPGFEPEVPSFYTKDYVGAGISISS